MSPGPRANPRVPGRRRVLRAAAALLAAGAGGAARAGDAPAAAQAKVLRYAFVKAETSFDPAAVNDLYSRIITGHVFEGLVGYDPLARPALLVPRTAEALPEIANDFRRFTFRLKPGTWFADDPVFGGKRRELVAQDYVYALQRIADPAVRSPQWGSIEQCAILGLADARRRAADAHRPFDYDAPVEGLRALDRYTLRIELAEPRPRLVEVLAQGDIYGAVAREVVERYGADIGAHPVGTGPFRLAQWRRASRIVLERNPDFRVETYAATPAEDDVEGQALLARFKGRRLPMVDRVEVSIIEEEQPRWLSFLDRETNFIERVPEAFIGLAMPGGRLARNLARQGVQAYRMVAPDALLTMFNMEDPVVGGLDPAHVALRRAIGLAIDTDREARLVRHGQMIAAQSQVVPHTTGYDAGFRSEMGDFDLARARALLDLYGYVDRDRDGWRERPDGSPLTLVVANQSDPVSHQLGEMWQHNMAALGVRVDFRIAQWPENLKAARAGKLMVWDVASTASVLDGQQALERLYGPSSAGSNIARFRLPAFDAIYDRMLVLPNGPERDALFVQLKRLAVAYMPYKVRGHRIITDLAWPQVVGFRRPLCWVDWWQHVDVVEPPPK